MRRRPALLALLLPVCVAWSTTGTGPATTPATTAATGATGATTPAATAPAATGPATTPATSPVTTPVAAPALSWTPIGDRLDEAHLQVPLDGADPSAGTAVLYLVRHRADSSKRIGSLLVNPGGPGAGGSYLATDAEGIYSASLLDAFDIVAWDPRGTGRSTPAIDCVDDADVDSYYDLDITPDDAAEVEAIRASAKKFAAACVARSGSFMRYMGTNESAQDIDRIRQALGEARISYFGFSYGSELGATWATMFPTTVRAAVLDGAADPTATISESTTEQYVGFNHVLDTYFAQCAKDTSCPFNSNGDPASAFDTLMTSLDDRPIPSVSGRIEVNRNVALTAVFQALYSPYDWPTLSEGLANAEHGDGAALLGLYDAYMDRQANGSYSNLNEAFQVITCMDDSERSTIAQSDADAAKLHAVTPRLAPGTTDSYFCNFFPVAPSDRITITGKGAGPIVVVGTTGDPATPLDSSRKMAAALQDGRLVVVTADQHTGYDVNQCSRDTVDNYLLDPVNNVPANGTTCP